MTQDSVALEIEMPREVPEGQAVPIALRLQNTLGERVELHLLGRTPTFDITITDEAGQVVWRRLQGQGIPAILQLRPLGPGETLIHEDRWDQRSNSGEPVGPGVYKVTGALLTDEPTPISSPTVVLRIVGAP